MSIEKLRESLVLMKMFSFDSVCEKLNQDLKFHARLSKMMGDNQKNHAQCFLLVFVRRIMLHAI